MKNLVVVGTSGAEYGIFGHVDAYDLDTGRRVWRRYNIPKEGEPGWPKGDARLRGGGSAWITGTYDPELDLMYWGTGNPSPDFDGSVRPGDNLYTSSVLAIDADDGKMRWHYQWTPHDLWDFDGNNENILFDLDGQKLLAHFDKNGYFFVLERTNGKLVRVAPFAERVTWGEIDRTGKVTPKKVPTKQGVDVCPGPAGTKEWTHAAYSPKTRLLYVPIIESCANFRVEPVEFREGLAYYGGEANTGPLGLREGLRPGHRQGRVGLAQRQADGRLGAGHGGRPGLRRRAHGGVQRLRRPHRPAAVAASDPAAATTAARQATASTASSTLPCRPGGAAGSRGSPPAPWACQGGTEASGGRGSSALMIFALP